MEIFGSSPEFVDGFLKKVGLDKAIGRMHDVMRHEPLPRSFTAPGPQARLTGYPGLPPSTATPARMRPPAVLGSSTRHALLIGFVTGSKPPTGDSPGSQRPGHAATLKGAFTVP